MFWKDSQFKSFFLSILIHISILLLFMAFKFTPEYDMNEYVTIGFGTSGKLSFPGAEKKEEVKSEKRIVNKRTVKVPKTKNSDETNKIAFLKEKKTKKKVVQEKSKKVNKGNKTIDEGTGQFGFELDFGGKGKRKIYSYNIPSYPSGVSKEIDVKLRFSILPDGSVGTIILLKKADTKLETAAINSLRQWRFESLPTGQQKKPQIAVITFPFRLQ